MKLSFYYYWVLTQTCYYLGDFSFFIGDFICNRLIPDSVWQSDSWVGKIGDFLLCILFTPYSFFINKSIDFNDKGNIGLWLKPTEEFKEN